MPTSKTKTSSDSQSFLVVRGPSNISVLTNKFARSTRADWKIPSMQSVSVIIKSKMLSRFSRVSEQCVQSPACPPSCDSCTGKPVTIFLLIARWKYEMFKRPIRTCDWVVAQTAPMSPIAIQLCVVTNQYRTSDRDGSPLYVLFPLSRNASCNIAFDHMVNFARGFNSLFSAISKKFLRESRSCIKAFSSFRRVMFCLSRVSVNVEWR